MVGRGEHRRDLALAERVVQGRVDQRRRNAEPGGGVAIDLDRDMRRGNLLVGRDVLQFRQLPHRRFEDRRPMGQFAEVGVGQRVLVLGAAETAADRDVLPGLHEELGAFDRGDLGPQALDDLVRAHVALVMRLQLNEHPRGVLGRVVGISPGKPDDAGDAGVLTHDIGDAGEPVPPSPGTTNPRARRPRRR